MTDFIAHYAGRHFLCVRTHGIGQEPSPTVIPREIAMIDGVWHTARGAVPWAAKFPVRVTRYVDCGKHYQPIDLATL